MALPLLFVGQTDGEGVGEEDQVHEAFSHVSDDSVLRGERSEREGMREGEKSGKGECRGMGRDAGRVGHESE